MLDRDGSRPIAFRPDERFPCGIRAPIRCIYSIDTRPQLLVHAGSTEGETRRKSISRPSYPAYVFIIVVQSAAFEFRDVAVASVTEILRQTPIVEHDRLHLIDEVTARWLGDIGQPIVQTRDQSARATLVRMLIALVQLFDIFLALLHGRVVEACVVRHVVFE